MWYPIGDYSLDQAQKFLREDFKKVLQRTKYLYVDIEPHPDIGYGFFEPILLCSCWCDFLGALYAGDARIGNEQRIKAFVDKLLGDILCQAKSSVSIGMAPCMRMLQLLPSLLSFLMRVAISARRENRSSSASRT